MAALLALLKSRLLLPPDSTQKEPSGAELNVHLTSRLEWLEAMRIVSIKLMERDQLGRDIFCGNSQDNPRARRVAYSVTLLDLM